MKAGKSPTVSSKGSRSGCVPSRPLYILSCRSMKPRERLIRFGTRVGPVLITDRIATAAQSVSWGSGDSLKANQLTFDCALAFQQCLGRDLQLVQLGPQFFFGLFIHAINKQNPLQMIEFMLNRSR
jgi:hypothetical protein